jgi:2-polyprenyl-6-methoxyphenol hydroxylase-like FAD-dependent oxidoreductase
MDAKKAILDVIVIGAGPVGLTAATYFGRFRRRCLVFEDGDSRAGSPPAITSPVSRPELVAPSFSRRLNSNQVNMARKSAATAALYTALSLLIGGFIAGVAAAIGGRLRDEHL